MKFEEYPLRIPSFKRVEKKIEKFILDFKNSKSAKEAQSVIKRFNRFEDDLSTDITIISIRYSLNIEDPVYQKAQDKVDEISPLISNLMNNWNKELLKTPFRKELEQKFGNIISK